MAGQVAHRMRITKTRKSERCRMGKPESKKSRHKKRGREALNGKPKSKAKQEARNGETEAKRVTHESQARRSEGGTTVCENSTRLVALTGKTRLGISEQLSLKLGTELGLWLTDLRNSGRGVIKWTPTCMRPSSHYRCDKTSAD